MTGKPLGPGDDIKAELFADEGLDDAVKRFESDGYVVVPSLVSRQVVERMRRAFYYLRSTEALAGSRSSIWIQNVLEKRADVAWLTASHPLVLRLLERLMGPFVQIESIVLAGFPPVPKDCDDSTSPGGGGPPPADTPGGAVRPRDRVAGFFAVASHPRVASRAHLADILHTDRHPLRQDGRDD